MPTSLLRACSTLCLAAYDTNPIVNGDAEQGLVGWTVRVESNDNDGHADNLSFTISAVPEPGTTGLLLAGLGATGLHAAHRRTPGDAA